MKKCGFHHVITSDGQRLDLCIVEFGPQGRVLRCYTFTQEEPFVEWIGGTLDLRDENNSGLHSPFGVQP